MENCPNCQNQVCVNPSFTQTLNFLDLVTESNSFEMETNEEEIMSEMSLVSQGVKLAKMKIYESGFDNKSDIRKKHSKIRHEQRKQLNKNKHINNNN